MLNASPVSPMNDPPPSSCEFGRFISIYLRIVVAGFMQVEERFELFELL
jgi:hypothetical protein